ncbi:PREDICTED: uncharacterized protein LOC104733156 [Camelina sativa]|uniref:Uncharacterized protein LOC104733156 n=1 Tax=Camelina sativa TaxID=90675 RepID=A0ABM0V5H2_CAMSA|nr:PREDICTED: uncharacterized protein LOC104733156 [Camelina sativa]
MDVGSAAWKQTCPVTITNDEAMEIYLAMHEETSEVPLYISELSVEQSVDANALQILEEKVMEDDDDYGFNYWQQYGDGNDVYGSPHAHEAAVEYEGDDISVGHVFTNKHDCLAKLAVYALNRRFQFHRRGKKLTTLTWISDSCPWRVYIIKLEDSDNYQITSANLRHTCSVVDEDRNAYRLQAKTKFLRSLKKSKFAQAIDLQKLLDNHKAMVSYWKAWESREPDNSFALLPSYLYCLGQAYTGTVTHLHQEANKFKYLFLAFSFSLSGFASMRRVIILDAAPIRGRFEGCLLIASCQDPNFQEYPLAFGIVDEENDEAWDWFFRMLNTVIPDSDNLAFVSEWHSSICAGIRRVYPKSSHGACVVHLHREVCTIFDNRDLADLVSEAARAYRVDDFHAAFAEIGRIEPECANYLEGIGFCHWARSHFMGNRYNIMTCNVAKSVNSVLKEAREFPIIPLMEFIRTTLLTWFVMRPMADLHRKWIRERIRQNLKISEGLTAQRVDAFEYDVRGDSRRRSFHVNLKRRTCTCREYNLLGIPCSHAICAAVADGYAIHELVGLDYTTG